MADNSVFVNIPCPILVTLLGISIEDILVFVSALFPIIVNEESVSKVIDVNSPTNLNALCPILVTLLGISIIENAVL